MFNETEHSESLEDLNDSPADESPIFIPNYLLDSSSQPYRNPEIDITESLAPEHPADDTQQTTTAAPQLDDDVPQA